MGKPEDVVDAGTRLMADSRINGRALAIGPKVTVDSNSQLVPDGTKDGKQLAVWEAYADDFVEVGKLCPVLGNVHHLTSFRCIYSTFCGNSQFC